MDVRTQDAVERLKEILRAKVNDPIQPSRGSTRVQTLTTGTHLTFDYKELKNVDSAIGVSTSSEYYRFKDFSLTFDDPSDSSDYPEITFSTQPESNESVEISYHTGSTFIYPTWPSENISEAIISINHVGGSEYKRYLGLKKSGSTTNEIHQTTWQIDVWVEDGVSVTDPDSEHTGFYAGGKLCDYLGDEVKRALEENRDHLQAQGISDVSLGLERDDPFQSDVDSHRKVLNFTLTHEHQW